MDCPRGANEAEEVRVHSPQWRLGPDEVQLCALEKWVCSWVLYTAGSRKLVTLQ